jgi:hypothetical protein
VNREGTGSGLLVLPADATATLTQRHGNPKLRCVHSLREATPVDLGETEIR